MDGQQQQGSKDSALAGSVDQTCLPQQSPASSVNPMDVATAMLLTQAAAVFVTQQAIAMQVHRDLQQSQDGRSTDGGCGSGQQTQGIASAAAEGVTEVLAYGPPPLAPFDMWQPQVRVSQAEKETPSATFSSFLKRCSCTVL